MAATILESTSTETIFKINNWTWDEEGEIVHINDKEPAFYSSESKCPWVKYENLYMSVSTTGNQSWPPIVRDVFATKADTQFTILTGRHGDRYGQSVDWKTGTFLADVPAAEHTEQDRKVAEALKKDLKGLNIEVIDVGIAPHNNVKNLRTLATTNLQMKHVVIFAWCFSLLAQKEHPNNGRMVLVGKGKDAKITVKKGGGEIPLMVVKSYVKLACATPIKQILADDYGWVLAASKKKG